MGRYKNYNTVAPETRHKDAKKDAYKTNNQASVGMSIIGGQICVNFGLSLHRFTQVCS